MQIDLTSLHAAQLAPVFDAFAQAGCDLFYVGGCVRNAVMGVPTTDIDLATNARPETTRYIGQALGLNVIATGEAHGTLTYMIDGVGFEITSFRQDVSTDGRRATVAFSNSIVEDAKRRDFTMNALYADRDGTIFDPLVGLQDAIDRRLRFIGDPKDRIREDFLRILRFFRFYAWYSDPQFGLDADGLAACAMLSDGLKNVSKERIGAELAKALAADDPAPAMAAMEACGVLTQILPGAATRNLPILTMLEDGIDPNALRRLAVIGGDDVQDHLRLSNAQSKLLERIGFHARNTDSALEHGYRLGATTGWDAWLVRCALLETHPMPKDQAKVSQGAESQFPLVAADIIPVFQGQEIGLALKRAETYWLSTGATASRQQVLDFLQV